jgi:hypothetical protein
LLFGETFRSKVKRGEVRLAWTVTESDPPRVWTVEADTDFIGKIVVRYTFEATANGTKYTRTLCNPDRPSEPSPEQVARMDEEALIGLRNIKRNVGSVCQIRSGVAHDHRYDSSLNRPRNARGTRAMRWRRSCSNWMNSATRPWLRPGCVRARR